jgi:hypothetical protein
MRKGGRYREWGRQEGKRNGEGQEGREKD